LYEVSEDGFSAEWRISSFGRSYPQTFNTEDVGFDQVFLSTAGADLHQVIDIYTMVFRSVKYSILFIVITFAAFFLFDILGGIRVHPIQYLLVGAALALWFRAETAKARGDAKLAERACDTVEKQLLAAEEKCAAAKVEADAKITASEELRHDLAGRWTAASLEKDALIDHMRRLLDVLAKSYPGAGGARLDAAGELLPIAAAVPEDPAAGDRPPAGAVPEGAARPVGPTPMASTHLR